MSNDMEEALIKLDVHFHQAHNAQGLPSCKCGLCKSIETIKTEWQGSQDKQGGWVKSWCFDMSELPIDEEGSHFLLLLDKNAVAENTVVQVSPFEGRLYPDALDGLIDYDDAISDAVAWMPLHWPKILPQPPKAAP